MTGSGSRTTHPLRDENGHGQGQFWIGGSGNRAAHRLTIKNGHTDEVNAGWEGQDQNYAQAENQKWTWRRSENDTRVRKRNYAHQL